jgi:hypothetical protein
MRAASPGDRRPILSSLAVRSAYRVTRSTSASRSRARFAITRVAVATSSHRRSGGKTQPHISVTTVRRSHGGGQPGYSPRTRSRRSAMTSSARSGAASMARMTARISRLQRSTSVMQSWMRRSRRFSATYSQTSHLKGLRASPGVVEEGLTKRSSRSSEPSASRADATRIPVHAGSRGSAGFGYPHRNHGLVRRPPLARVSHERGTGPRSRSSAAPRPAQCGFAR